VRRLLLAAVLVLVAVQGIAAWRWIRFDRLFVLARNLDGEGRYTEALLRMEEAARICPSDARTRAWVGDIGEHAHEQRRTPWTPEAERQILDRAWAGYAGSVSIAPLDSWSWSGLAEVATRLARLKDKRDGVSIETLEARSRAVLDPWRTLAFGAAQIAVSLKPSGYQELDVLAEVYESSGEVEQATDVYVRSARLMPAPSFHAWGDGRVFPEPIYKRLFAALVDGIAASPPYDWSLLHLEVARFARNQGDAASAISEARLAAATARNDFEKHQSAMEVGLALAESDPTEALQSWRRAATTGYDPGVVARNIASLESRLGELRNACGHYAEALRVFPSDMALRVEAAGACERAGEAETAEQILRDGTVDPAEAMPVAEALVSFLERTDRLNTAAALVKRWISEDPNQAEFRAWEQRIVQRQNSPPPPPSRAGRTGPASR